MGDRTNFDTPKNTKIRRLGLRKNASTNSSTDKALNNSLMESQCKSDSKLNVKTAFSPVTPSGGATDPKINTTNCRPYRLTLRKNLRDRMTKKRLQFHLANESVTDHGKTNENFPLNHFNGEYKERTRSIMEADSKKGTSTTHASPTQMITVASIETKPFSEQDLIVSSINENKSITDNAVKDHIETKEKEVELEQNHLKKVKELKELIELWKNGFNAALEDLNQEIHPQLSKSEILDKFGIPQTMMKYLND